MPGPLPLIVKNEDHDFNFVFHAYVVFPLLFIICWSLSLPRSPLAIRSLFTIFFINWWPSDLCLRTLYSVFVLYCQSDSQAITNSVFMWRPLLHSGFFVFPRWGCVFTWSSFLCYMICWTLIWASKMVLDTMQRLKVMVYCSMYQCLYLF